MGDSNQKKPDLSGQRVDTSIYKHNINTSQLKDNRLLGDKCPFGGRCLMIAGGRVHPAPKLPFMTDKTK